MRDKPYALLNRFAPIEKQNRIKDSIYAQNVL